MKKLGPVSFFILSLLFLFPTISQAEQSPKITSDFVTTSSDATYDKVLDKLFNNNYIILAANQQLGFITFRTQSEDNSNSARRHVNVLEGTIFLHAENFTTTRIRVKLTLSWQETYDTAGTFRTGAQQEADAGWYKSFFNMLGLTATSSNK
jgi:hypothetical protein